MRLSECFMDKKTNININSQYNIGLVLGCGIYDVMIRRVDEAYNLYKKGIIKKIYLTGGIGLFSKIRKNTEANIMRDYLISRGIDLNDITTECKSSTTIENIKNIIKIIDNDYTSTSIVLITSDFHTKRAFGILKKINIKHDIYYYGIKDEYDRDNYNKTLRGLWVLGKEVYLLNRCIKRNIID